MVTRLSMTWATWGFLFAIGSKFLQNSNNIFYTVGLCFARACYYGSIVLIWNNRMRRNQFFRLVSLKFVEIWTKNDDKNFWKLIRLFFCLSFFKNSHQKLTLKRGSRFSLKLGSETNSIVVSFTSNYPVSIPNFEPNQLTRFEGKILIAFKRSLVSF